MFEKVNNSNLKTFYIVENKKSKKSYYSNSYIRNKY